MINKKKRNKARNVVINLFCPCTLFFPTIWTFLFALFCFSFETKS